MATNPIMAALNKGSTTVAGQAGQTNPQTITPEMQQQAMQTIQQYGGDGQKAFYAECQRRGIDPQKALPQIQAMFKQMFPNK